MARSKLVKILLIVLPMLVGLGSWYISKDGLLIYNAMQKPPLSPPGMVFSIAWTILYLLMGIASAIVYTNKDKIQERNLGLTLHFIQLILNFFWSIIFFNLGNYVFALIWLILLWLAVLAMISAYKKVSQTAYILNIPYICWLTFAAYLNLAVAIMNRPVILC